MNQATDTLSCELQPFRIADWRVDPSTLSLMQGSIEIRIEPKMMSLLVCLADRAGEPVSREELERLVWGQTVVGYDALTSSITKLRKALGDDSRQPRFIETVSKKGYRLIAPVGAVEPPTEEAVLAPHFRVPSRHRLWTTAIGLLVLLGLLLNYPPRNSHSFYSSVGDRPSIAVLPFDNPGHDPAQAYLSEGMTADINTAISRLSGLRVVASASARNLQASPGDVKQLAEELGVRYLLDGNVRSTGDRLRVNVQLVDATTGFQIWAERYDTDMRDVLDVEDDITTRIVNTLSIKLSETEKRQTKRLYMVDITAYDDFLRGQSQFARGTPEENLQARASFQQAIDRDPGFARAYSAMALTFVDEYRFGMGKNPAALERALDIANKAITLDDQLPQAYRALSYAQLLRREYQPSIDAIQRAIVLDPNDMDSRAFLAMILKYDGNYETAIRMLGEVVRQNPHHPARYDSALGQAYYLLGRYDDAVTTLREAIEHNATLLSSQIFYTAALSHLRRKEEAAWSAHMTRALSQDFSATNAYEMFPIKDPEKLRTLVGDLKEAGL